MTKIVRVRQDPAHKTRGNMQLGNETISVSLGRAGIVANKREGDGGTPAGRFAFRHIRYRKDRLAEPQTALTCYPIEPLDGWSDDIRDPDYNRLVHHPAEGKRTFSAEHLWREDHLYDIVIVIGHNDSPPVPGKGSAVFCHLMRGDFEPTEGCVAMALEDMLTFCAMIDEDAELVIEV